MLRVVFHAFAIVAIVLGATARRACAQDRDPWARQLTLAGSFMPLDPLGAIELEWAPTRYFGINVGAGYGTDGGRISTMARGRFVFERLAFGLGAGISEGPYRTFAASFPCPACDGPSSDFGWSRRASIDVELALEARGDQGVYFRSAFGARFWVPEWSSSAECIGGDCGTERSPIAAVALYVQFACGYSF